MVDGKTKNIVRGALVLSMAGFISKLLSAIYRIPLQNLTGDIGFYMYQQIYPILGMVMVLGLYGYPAAVSKIMAERHESNQANSLGGVYFPILMILLLFNGIIAILLYTLAPSIAVLVGDVTLSSTFQLSALLFILLPFIALFRGITQGHDTMLPTALSQVAEQVVRVTMIIMVSYLIYINRLDVYQIGPMAVYASLSGMVVAMMCWIFFGNKRTIPTKQNIQEKIPWSYYLKVCFSIGIIAAMTHMILLFMQFIDIFTIVPSLIQSGLPEIHAREMKGIFDRGQPLIQFGVVFGSSFALALVPTVVKKDVRRVEAIQDAMGFSFYFASAASLGLILLMPEVNRLLFMNTDGTISLQILVVSILLTAMIITAASVLQSMGYVRVVALSIVVAFSIKGVLNYLLVPSLNIVGSALATVGSLFILMIVVILLLHKKLPGLTLSRTIRWWPFFFASVSMSLFIMLTKVVLSTADMSRFGLLFYVAFTVVVGALLYVMLMLRWRVFSDKQLEALPFGNQMIALDHFIVKRKRG